MRVNGSPGAGPRPRRARSASRAHRPWRARRWRACAAAAAAGMSAPPPRARDPRSPGTEVLTGIISDRNGPWLSERLRELGVDAAMIEIVGDRPDDLLAALRYMRSRGDGARRHQRRPRTDRRRPHGRDRRAVQRARDGPRRRARGADRRDPAPDAGALAEPRRRGAAGLEPQAGRDPRGGHRARAGRNRARARRAPGRRRWSGRRRAARAAARAATDVVGRRSRTDAFRAAIAGAPTLERGMRPAVRHPRIRDRLDASRRRGRRDWSSPRSRSRPACAGGRSRSPPATNPPRPRPTRRSSSSSPTATPTRCSHSRRSTVDDQVVGAARRTHDRHRRVVHGRSARRAADGPAGLLAVLRRGHRRLLERGQDRPRRRRSGADRAVRRGLGRGRRCPRRRCERRVSGPRSGSASPESPDPDGGTEEKPVGLVCFSVGAREPGEEPGSAGRITRHVRLPGNRSDVRDRSTTVAMHLIRRLLEGGADRG